MYFKNTINKIVNNFNSKILDSRREPFSTHMPSKFRKNRLKLQNNKFFTGIQSVLKMRNCLLVFKKVAINLEGPKASKTAIKRTNLRLFNFFKMTFSVISDKL